MRNVKLGFALSLLIAAPAAADDPPDDPSDPSAAPTQTKKRKKSHKKKHEREPDFTLGAWDGTVDAKGSAVGGALSGRSTLRTSGALVGVEADATPAIEQGRWRLELPISAGHRETPGAELRETKGGLDAGLRWRKGPSLRVEAETGLRATWRPAWLDEYQPIAGGLDTTDRYSHLDLHVGAALAGIPLRHQHARLGLRYEHVDYVDDPSFNAVDEPTHLVPGDHDDVALAGSWRYLGDGWKLGGNLDLDRERWFLAYARDAGTGLTHAGAGGPPPNPFYREITLEPAAAAELSFRDETIELAVEYGYQIVSDRYQGYYSSRAHHPDVELRWKPGALELEVGFEAQLRTYGPDSYAAGNGHPALEGGDTRRAEQKLEATAGARWAGGKRWAVIGDGKLIRRTTNFPDYMPGVFPASRQYDIQWDYTNWQVTAGLELSR